MNTALLVIDMQRALCWGEEAAHDIEHVIAKINTLSQNARAANAPVVFVQHEEDNGPLQPGSGGWQIDPRLAAAPEEPRVRKRTPGSFHETGLHELLQQRGVQRLVICGLQSEMCVDTTARQALALGYHVVLVADAHSTVDNGVLAAAQISAHHNQIFRQMTSFGPRIAVAPTSAVSMEDRAAENPG